jgi:arylsulfatase A-like enzyme
MTGALNQFAKLINKLKNEGVYDNSLIIFTSDHGYEYFIQPSQYQGQKYLGSMINTRGFSSGSRYWPTLMLKLPNAKGPMNINSTPVELIDIMPTILESVDLKDSIPTNIDGFSLLDEQTDRTRKAMIYVGGVKNQSKKNMDSKLSIPPVVSRGENSCPALRPGPHSDVRSSPNTREDRKLNHAVPSRSWTTAKRRTTIENATVDSLN